MKDMNLKELQKLYESIYDGYPEKKDTGESEGEEKKESSEKKEPGEKKESSEKSETKSGESKGSSSEGKSEGESGPSKSIQSKVKALQKQYNDLIISAVETHAADCVDRALDESEGAFGENIHDVIDRALSYLKDKVLGELGVEPKVDIEFDGSESPEEIGAVLGGEKVPKPEPEATSEEKPAEKSEEKSEEESEEEEEEEEEEENPVEEMKMPKFKRGERKNPFKGKSRQPSIPPGHAIPSEKDIAKSRKFDWKKEVEQAAEDLEQKK